LSSIILYSEIDLLLLNLVSCNLT